MVKFQPTLPVRGATILLITPSYATCISTHAPRAGSDLRYLCSIHCGANFNPRSPCGERPVFSDIKTEYF